MTSAWHTVDAQEMCSMHVEGLMETPSRAIPHLQTDIRGHSYRNQFQVIFSSHWCPKERSGGEDERSGLLLSSLRGL